MPRPTKKIEIPWYDIKGIKTQLEEGKSHADIGQYFGVSQDTISRRIKQYKKEDRLNDESRNN